VKRSRTFKDFPETAQRLLVTFVLVLLSACSSPSTTPPGGTPDIPDDPGNPTPGQVPFTGVLTLDEYNWHSVEPYLGVIEIQLPAGTKTRILEGFRPWRHPSGKIVFSQGCGSYVNRVVISDAGLVTPVSPCSGDMTVPGDEYGQSQFGFSKLSPDQQKVAAEIYYLNLEEDRYVYHTVVFDLAGNTLALIEGASGPEWLPDGRLLVVKDGLYVTDAALTSTTRIDGGQLNSPVANPDVDPSGAFVAFEYNQQIWGMNLDGSGLRELISGAKYFKFPTWSPDGNTLAYLATEENDYYDKAVYFTDMDSGQDHVLDLSPVLQGTSNVPNGPLSWTQ
jgi:hypothetical protein